MVIKPSTTLWTSIPKSMENRLRINKKYIFYYKLKGSGVILEQQYFTSANLTAKLCNICSGIWNSTKLEAKFVAHVVAIVVAAFLSW